MKDLIKNNLKHIIIISVLAIAVGVFIAWVQLFALNDSGAKADVPAPLVVGEVESLSVPDPAPSTTPPATTIPPEITAPPETTAPPQTTAPETTAPPVTTAPPATTVPQVEQTLAPVQTLSEVEIDVIQQFDTEIEPEQTTVVQTAPPPTNGNMPAGAQGIDERGNTYKFEDGKKFIYDPVLGWFESKGAGSTIIMEVESSGEYYDASW